jgi:hypothetical protein
VDKVGKEALEAWATAEFEQGPDLQQRFHGKEALEALATAESSATGYDAGHDRMTRVHGRSSSVREVLAALDQGLGQWRACGKRSGGLSR